MEKLHSKGYFRISQYYASLFNYFFAIFFAITPVYAGPPFITDDAEPADYRQLQLYLYANVVSASHNTFLSAPAFEVDYGIIPYLELHLVTQIVTFFPETGKAATGIGDTETGFKYQFIHEGAYMPEFAFGPMFELPTGNARRNLGNGRAWYKVPIWLQKHWGAWTAYGGGGMVFNSAPMQKNYRYGGLAIQRTMNDQLMLGGEIYAQGSTATTRELEPFQDAGAATVLNLGGSYTLNAQTTFLFSLGHNIAGVQQWNSYIGLVWMNK